jgi:hypothetical protein
VKIRRIAKNENAGMCDDCHNPASSRLWAIGLRCLSTFVAAVIWPA